MKISSAMNNYGSRRWPAPDVSIIAKTSHHARLLTEGNEERVEEPSVDADSGSINSMCGDMSTDLFGPNNLTCQCSFMISTEIDDLSDNSTETNGIDIMIDCEGDEKSEVSLALKDGQLSSMEICGEYCNEYQDIEQAFEMGFTDRCHRICVTDSYPRGSETPSPTCEAKFNGDSCSSCIHQKPSTRSSSSWNSRGKSDDFCLGDDLIHLDCSGPGGRKYKNGQMCGNGGNITFEVVTYDGYGGYSGGYSGGFSYYDDDYTPLYSGSHSSYSSSSYSSSSSSGDDDFVVGFISFILFLFIFGARVLCAIAIRDHRRSRAAESVHNFRSLRQRRRENDSPHSIQLSAVRGQNPTNDPVELVLISLLQSNLAFAKETLLDEQKEFKNADPGEGDSVATKLKGCVKSGDWALLRDTLSGISNNDDRHHYFGIVGSAVEETWPKQRVQGLASFSPMLDAWKINEPDNVTCLVLRAEVGLQWAWHARSAALAFLVSDEQARLFHTRLQDAANEIDRAQNLCPSDPLIYPAAITIKKGLGDRRDNMPVDQCLIDLESISHEPLLYSANIRALAYYCKKWYGSHERMFSHARTVTSQLPDGHPLWVLIPMAHVERTMIETVRGYWRRPSVVNEIREAFVRAFPREAVHTEQATDPAAKSREMICRNYFCFCLAATGQYEEARHQIRIIGRRPIKGWPWGGGISTYKRVVDALGFDISPPNENDRTLHLTEAVATPIGDDSYGVPVAATVEIV